jgi:PAS domain S-box-containing protein
MESKLREERESLALRVEERTRQLAASNDFLDLILQALPIPIFIKNENLEYVDVNEAFTNFFGLEKEAIIGKTVNSYSSKERAAKVMHDDLSILHTGKRMTSQDRIKDKDGAFREIIIIRQSFTNPRTGEDGIVGTFLDISERVELQKQLEKTNEELNHAMHIKDEFLANISHELRTPLTSVIGYSEMLLSGMGGKLLDNQEKYLVHIYTAGEHLLTLITDILDYSKVNAEVTTLSLEMARVRSICIMALSIMEPRAFKKDVQIEFEFDDSITDLYCDPQRMKQILINLMNNAIKFSENYGSVGLRINKVNGDPPTIEFQVWDNGIGIDSEDQARIFEPFTQVASDLNRTYEGSGIGLALVKQFVELHDGKIWVESEPGNGSVFYIHMPMKDGP